MISGKKWDVVILGSGFGGSMAALQLARAGLKVILLERGRWVDRDDSAWDANAILIQRKYRSMSPYEADQWLGRRLIYPDEAVGGNSVFYGAASFRFRQQDFMPLEIPTTNSDRPFTRPGWPIQYEDLAPYYEEAENLLEVAGAAGSDPTEPPRHQDYPQPPIPYNQPARLLVKTAKALGLRPFPIPLAIHFQKNHPRPQCQQCSTCDLFPCKIGAKNDLSQTVLPAALKKGAALRPNTIAKKLIQKSGRIIAVECLDAETGKSFSIFCDVCIVSCGAIGSAKLLLASGLGNHLPHGRWIGKNLMRHCSGIVIGLFPFRTNPEKKFNKQVGITDFYFGHPEKPEPPGPWGMIQALQVPPPEYVQSQAPFPIGMIGAKTMPFHIYLLCIAEDLPNPQNRIQLDPRQKDPLGLPVAKIYHKYHRRDLQARQALYRQASRILQNAGAIIRIRKPINTYSHALGSCRFGKDPEFAALDPWCNFFSLANLFVVDGSFMPTSSGVNPSLTIAANGLRVGEHIAKNFTALCRESRYKAAKI